jgi:hypothetical protein
MMDGKRLAAVWIGGGWLLNLVWEVVQAPLFQDESGSTHHLGFCMRASFVDVLLVGGLFLFMAAAAQSWRWWQAATWRFATLAAAGSVVAITIEQRALALGDWTYAAHMPLVPGFGVGWSPVLQMMIVPPLLAAVSRCNFAAKGEQP